MTLAPEVFANRLEAELRAVGTPERAAGEKAYLKSDLEFLGVQYWAVGRHVKALAKELAPLDHDALIRLVEVLWSKPIFERRASAEMLLERFSSQLSVADLGLLERLIRESRTWALVDGLAAHVVGDILLGDADGATPILDRWAGDADFWVRRSSLLAELGPLRHGAPFERFARRADAMLDEMEFFIRKAIGWVLRETGKRRPDEVMAWLAPRTHRASGVTMREAVKYLPAPDGERLMAAYRERRQG